MVPPDLVLELIERFERNLDHYKQPAYKHTQVRVEFIPQSDVDAFLERRKHQVRVATSQE